MLLSSWLRSAGPTEPVAWVGVERDESDATRFLASVMEGMLASGAIPPGDPLATLVPASLGGQDEFLERLLEGIGRLPSPVIIVIDDLHQLRSDDALRTLEHLVAYAPEQLRTILVSRREPALGLHRLRLDGGLMEIRAADLEFTAGEAGELMTAAGVTVAQGELERLRLRTEGWAAGLRLAAMSLARHDDPGRFVAEFSGSERTVSDYLLHEVLAGQPPEVRQLLLRTCILDRVSGPLGDILTGRSDSARMLHELEEANAFVVAIDVARDWFRYHQLLTDLLRVQLRHDAPGEVAGLHGLAADWFADHGDPIAAIRHAELAEDWQLAAELLGRHWVQLVLDGEEATLRTLLAGLPPGLADTDSEVATIAAAGRLTESRWADADALLAAADRALPEVPAARRRRAETAMATVQLFRARRLGDLEAVVEGAGAMLGDGEGDAAAAGPELQALALVNLGIAQNWTLRLPEAEQHLERGLALGRQIHRPYVEVNCLAGLGIVATMTNRLDRAEYLFRQAIEVAEHVGWAAHPITGVAYMMLGQTLIDRGRLAEGEEWIARADPVLAVAAEPAASVALRHCQGMLAMCRGRFADAHQAFEDAERLARQLRAPYFLAAVARQWQLRSLLRLGDVEPVRVALDEARTAGDENAQWCNLEAHLRLAADDAQGAAAALAPALSGAAYSAHVNVEIETHLLDALARSGLGEHEAAERSVERVLELAEPQGRVWIVLTVPGALELLASHPSHRTAHGAYLKQLLDHLAGVEFAEHDSVPELPEQLSERELSVLRFLPTNLSAGEIGNELFLSVHTVKTHMRKLYAKLDVHTRAEAVERARALGLLGPGRRSG
jgi:LuxR family maltose regulon positive regulatory protein